MDNKNENDYVNDTDISNDYVNDSQEEGDGTVEDYPCVQCLNNVITKDRYYYLYNCPEKCLIHEECAVYLMLVYGRETW